jgi:hypothetical protein
MPARREPRPTKDAEILVDIVTNPSLLDDVTHYLEASGYRLQDSIGDGDRPARCSFAFYSAQIDVLCPDDTPDNQLVVEHRQRVQYRDPGRKTRVRDRPPSQPVLRQRPSQRRGVRAHAGRGDRREDRCSGRPAHRRQPRVLRPSAARSRVSGGKALCAARCAPPLFGHAGRSSNPNWPHTGTWLVSRGVRRFSDRVVSLSCGVRCGLAAEAWRR